MPSPVATAVKDQDLIARRHDQICDAAVKLFTRKGFHNTTVREIAEASGLGIGTLYAYIKTKEDILYLIYDRIFTRFRDRMLAAAKGIDDPTTQLRVALETTFRIYHDYQDLVLLLYQESHVLGKQALQSLFEVDRSYVAFFREILERGQAEGQFRRQDANLVGIAAVFLCAVLALKRWNLRGYRPEEVAEHLMDLIFRGILNGREPGDAPRGGGDAPPRTKEGHR
ncbi:MAG TPA: TetR/AcrR family transcriptional regulator [Candidatus Methylomirabilis sp.]|nr:TetR/AcrR family transcriptional regulator [Candidatus Methylomirabilis sp.]